MPVKPRSVEKAVAPQLVLLLSDNPRWIDVAGAATSRLELPLQVMNSPRDAMVLLAGMHGVCRLLLDPETAGRSVVTLIEMTCGEVDSGVDVIMLGGVMPDVQSIADPDVDTMAAALVSPEPFCYEWSGQPPLEAGQVLQMMKAGNVQVRFQPIVNIRDRSLIALEVLARLHRTTCSILPPHRFIPQLEQAGFGTELLRHVTEAAFSAAGSLGDARLALNLPLNVLNDRRTVEMLAQIREKAGVPAVRILLELTETEVVDNVSMLDPVIGRWREAGYTLAIDDAGPGVPHHRDMFGLPFEWVKLDKAVVHQALNSSAARHYMADTVASAHRANLSVIAEGIETEATWDLLADLGVDCGQGFMISRPLPADVVPVWRKAWAASDGHLAAQFPSWNQTSS